jgi:2-oxoglutarate dehydrogenase E1 component
MVDSLLKQFAQTSQLGANGAYVEDLYEQYLVAPDSVDAKWRQYFDGLKGREAGDIPHSAVIEQIAQAGRLAARGVVTAASGVGDERERGVGKLITAYRSRGHLAANLDPLGLTPKPEAPDLALGFHRLSESDTGSEFSTGGVAGRERMKLGELEGDLCRQRRRRVHAHHRRRTAPLDVRAPGSRRRQLRPHGRRQAAHPRTPDRGRGARALPAHQIRRPEALLAGRRRQPDPDAGRDDPARRRRRGQGHRHRHGPPRSPQRADQHVLGKPPRKLFDEFEGKFDAQPRRRPRGRREVPHGLLRRHRHPRAVRPPGAGVQPVAPGDRQSGGRSARCVRANCAATTRSASRSCRSCSTAMPRSPARAW